MKEKMRFYNKLIFSGIIVLIISMLIINYVQFSKTKDFIEKHNCQTTNEVRYSGSKESGLSSKVKYVCDDGKEYWLDDYHEFDSLKVWE